MTMSDLEIMDRQATLIEKQRTLFKNTVAQFKKDITYLRGCLDVMMIEHDNTRYISNDSMALIASHLSDMDSMLNDFDARMKDYD